MKKFLIILVSLVMYFSLASIVSAVNYAPGCDGYFFNQCGGGSRSCSSPYACQLDPISGCYVCSCTQTTTSGNGLTDVGPGTYFGQARACVPYYNGSSCTYTEIGGWGLFCGAGADTGSGTPTDLTNGTYTVSILPTLRSVTQGGSTSYTVTITPDARLVGQTINVALEPNGCPNPPNATCSFVGGYSGSYYNSDGFWYSSPPVQQINVSITDTNPKSVTFSISTNGSMGAITWPFTIKTKRNDSNFGPSVTGQLTVSPAGGTNPSIQVDVPANNATVSGTVSTSGWAIDNTTYIESAISAVKVYLDGTLLGNATYGGSRSDVCTNSGGVYPGRVGCPNVGWSYNWNSVGATNGLHSLRFDAIDSDSTPHVASMSRTVTTANAPTVTLTAAPSSGTGSVNTRLTWSSTNASSCSASANPANASWTGSKATASSQIITVTTTTTFTLTCTNGYGPATASATVTVSPAAPTVTVTATPSTGPAPLTSTVTWSSTGSGNTCNASGGWTASNIGSSGSQSITVNSSTSVLITCTNAGGPGSGSVTVTPTTNYTLSVTGSRGGRVTSGDGFISCGTTCSYNYAANASVTLTATPDSGYWKFSGWSGACTGTGACVVTMNSSKAVTATFVPRPFDYREF